VRHVDIDRTLATGLVVLCIGLGIAAALQALWLGLLGAISIGVYALASLLTSSRSGSPFGVVRRLNSGQRAVLSILAIALIGIVGASTLGLKSALIAVGATTIVLVAWGISNKLRDRSA